MGISQSATGAGGRFAALAIAVAAFWADAASAQDRTPCRSGTPGAPSVYIDSSSPEVLVLTSGGGLVPLDDDESRATREERLIRAGILRPARGPRKKLGLPKSRPEAGAAVLEALLAERGEGQ